MRVLLLLSALILSSCTSSDSGHRFYSIYGGQGMGVLYVYRPNLLTSMFTKAEVSVADKKDVLDNGTYAAWVLPQGEYEVKSSCMDTSNGKDLCPGTLTLQVVAGEEHFVRFNAGGGKDIAGEISATVGRVTNEKMENSRKGFLQYMGRPEGKEEIKVLKLCYTCES